MQTQSFAHNTLKKLQQKTAALIPGVEEPDGFDRFLGLVLQVASFFAEVFFTTHDFYYVFNKDEKLDEIKRTDLLNEWAPVTLNKEATFLTVKSKSPAWICEVY